MTSRVGALRAALETIVFVTMALVSSHALVGRGWFSAVRVFGPSMAPYCVGEHYLVTCEQCARPLSIAREFWPRDGRWLCPACGEWQKRADRSELLPILPGTRVAIDFWSWSLRAPQRWELAALRDPRNRPQYNVKRIVGRPGETVTIRAGQLLVNGTIPARDWPTVRDMRILVDDAAPAVPWNAHQAGQSTWRYDPKVWHLQPTMAGGDGRDAAFRLVSLPSGDNIDTPWLEYWHVRPLPPPTPALPRPVGDLLSYNQGLSHAVYPVRDLFLQVRLAQIPTNGTLRVRWHDGTDDRMVTWEAAQQRWTVAAHGVPLQTARYPLVAGDDLVLGVWDEALHVVVSDCPLLNLPWPTPSTKQDGPRAPDDFRSPQGPATQPQGPVALAVAEAGWELSNFQVWRDVWYLAPRAGGPHWSESRRVGSDHYFLLGDNVVASDDSRTWPDDAVPSSALWGRVFRWSVPKSVR